jgi:hypothetical protein
MLLAACWTAATPAWADCGHGVASDASRHFLHAFANLEILSHPFVLLPDSDPAMQRSRTPCAGFSCSQQQKRPPVPAIVMLATSDSWCIATVAPQWPAPDLTVPSADFSTPHPRRTTLAIERPPRGLS